MDFGEIKEKLGVSNMIKMHYKFPKGNKNAVFLKKDDPVLPSILTYISKMPLIVIIK